MTDQTPPNIFQRINAVRQDVKYIRKDAAVQGYYAVSHDAVTAELRPALIKHGIVVVPTITHGRMLETGSTTSKGVPIFRYEGVYEIAFINEDEPNDRVTITVEAHALDYGDKAPGKALSYATKYALLKVFSIETGEDDESREEQKPKLVTDDQLIELTDLCKKYGFPIDSTLKRLASKVFGYKDIEHLPERYFVNAKDELIKKGEEKNATAKSGVDSGETGKDNSKPTRRRARKADNEKVSDVPEGTD